jgi:hypothetical protein
MPDDDVIAQLARYGEAVEAAMPAYERQRRRRWPLGAGVAAAVVALVAVLAWPDADRADVATTPTTAPTTEDVRIAGWDLLPPAPISPWPDPVVVATDHELVVWGVDGAVFDTDTGTWRRMAPGPLAPRSGALGVWTGSEVFVVGGSVADELFSDAAAYDLATDTWRTLPELPAGLVATRASAVAAGDRVVVSGLEPRPNVRMEMVADTYALLAQGGDWRPVPNPLFGALIVVSRTVVWTGTDAWVVGIPPSSNVTIAHLELGDSPGNGTPVVLDTGVRGTATSREQIAALGSTLVIGSHVSDGAVIDLATGDVDPIPPTDLGIDLPAAALDPRTVAFGSQWLDPPTGRWSPAGTPFVDPPATAVALDGRYYVVGAALHLLCTSNIDTCPANPTLATARWTPRTEGPVVDCGRYSTRDFDLLVDGPKQQCLLDAFATGAAGVLHYDDFGTDFGVSVTLSVTAPRQVHVISVESGLLSDPGPSTTDCTDLRAAGAYLVTDGCG